MFSRYNIDYGSVHYLVMSTEHNFTKGSVQYQYLENDLQNVDRSLTPWLVVIGHRYTVKPLNKRHPSYTDIESD